MEAATRAQVLVVEATAKAAREAAQQLSEVEQIARHAAMDAEELTSRASSEAELIWRRAEAARAVASQRESELERQGTERELALARHRLQSTMFLPHPAGLPPPSSLPQGSSFTAGGALGSAGPSSSEAVESDIESQRLGGEAAGAIGEIAPSLPCEDQQARHTYHEQLASGQNRAAGRLLRSRSSPDVKSYRV
jgi:hypothetical protein